MTATVAGGTGLTGSALVRRLLADPAITRVISVSRKPSAVPDAKLTEVLISELEELSSIASRIRGDIYFCCLGTTLKAAGSKANFEKVDHGAIVAFATVARAHDAKSVTLVSAMGADARSRFFYNRIKGRTEDDVKALGLSSLIILKPALLVGPRRESRVLERIASTLLVPLARWLPARARKSMITDVEVLAARMLAEALAAPAGLHVIAAADI